MGQSYAYIGTALGGFPDLVRLPSFSLALFIIFDHFGKLIHSPPLLHLVSSTISFAYIPTALCICVVTNAIEHLANGFEIE